jgi:hypothetical protein
MRSNVLILNKYICPVCGFLLDYPPRDFNICPSCGVEFGADTVEYSYDELRQAWRERGQTWSSSVIERPANYNPQLQLQNLGALKVVAEYSRSQGKLSGSQPDRILPVSSTTVGTLRLQRA